MMEYGAEMKEYRDKNVWKKAACILLSAVLYGCAQSATAVSSAASSPSAKSTASASTATSPKASVASDSSFTVSFLDVGQGDSSLIQCDGKYMLIDGGEPDQSQKIYTILKDRGITHLDYMVATHTDSDHVGGLAGALQTASCDQAFCSVTTYTSKTFQKFTSQLESHNVPLTVPNVGDVYTLGSASFKVLGPTDIEDSMSANNKSLVLRFDYGSTSFLFTGDAEQEEQQLIMNNDYDDLKVNVLKADHHGSSNGASSAWLKAVNPDITVVSCGTNNKYGHPHQEFLNLLKNTSSALYRTDLQGEITVTSDGSKVTAQVSKNVDADVWQPGSKESSDATAAPAEETTAAAVTDTVSSTYVLNTNSKKFHLPSCKSAAKISASNRQEYTGDRQSLIDQGYEPCKICNP